MPLPSPKSPGQARLLILAWAAGVVLLTGCGASLHTTRPPTLEHEPAEQTSTSALEQELRGLEAQWHGTPHQWGGNTRNGVDCSGFVFAVYDDLFEMQLPRTTHEQVKLGEAIRPGRWQAGDLIFFKPSKSNHVGIYLGNGEFAHASTSQGVMISRVDEPYWQGAYWTSRRLPLPRHGMATVEAEPEPKPTLRGLPARRTGW